ncbi:MAG: M14 family zinc carboxypeptidase [Armatimonadota bacterium]
MGIQLWADYENANGRLVAVEDGPVVRFEAEARRSPRPLWFRFWLSGLPRARTFDLVLANANECLGGVRSFAPARPVYRVPAGQWRRCEVASIDEQAGEFRFTCPTGLGDVEVAFSNPYNVSDLRAWIAGLPPRVACEELCVSPGGLSVPLLRVGDAARARRGVWAIGRQHAGEAPGSWALQGLVDWLLPEADTEIALNVVPMMDIDGVQRGDYGKSAWPHDFWEDWSGESCHHAVAATRAAIDDWAERAPYDLLLDFHAPLASDGNHAYGIPAPTEELEAARQRLLKFLGFLTPEECPFDTAAGNLVRDPELIARSTEGAQMARHGVLALCVECSYHRTSAETWTNPASLRRFGAAVGEAITQYFMGG